MVEVFPNPAHEKLNIKINNCSPKSVELVDQSGQTAYFSDKYVESIDLGNFTAGHYMLLFIQNDGSYISKKVVIQN
ncbi:T9SS type A sorting domain-containing protein [Dyadobacter chenwenxiniae]|uniref:T9SS type A sorting domain-containing protein n=1 Tax=Dyadobacter chenwenxiniae TaxID=2906456 RepID=UPI0035B5E474